MAGNKASVLADFCLQKGWAYTCFDYQGHGLSSGDIKQLTLHDWLQDTLTVMDAQSGPVLLVGSSMGAWLATRAALQRSDKISGLLLLAAAPDFLQELVQPKLEPSDIWDLQQGQAIQLENNYEAPYPITQALLDSGIDLAVLDSDIMNTLTCPVRLIHGTHDTDVPYSLALRLMNSIAHADARLSLMHMADHRLSDERCLGAIKQELAAMMSAVR